MKRNRFRTTFAVLALAGTSAFTAPVLQAKPDSPALALARQLNQAFVEVAEDVSPSVVVIRVAQKQDALFSSGEGNPLLEMMPEGLRKEFEKHSQRPRPKGRGPQFNGQGSGIVLRDDGYILTNHHVVEEAEKIEVQLKDGRTFEAELQGTDPQSDLAVVRLKKAPKDLVVAKLADSAKVRVGEFAIAIGAPFDLDYSVTYGHVSAKGRNHVIPGFQGQRMDQDFIQTDANINPGNSGGPLVNIDGEVIGINAIIRGLNSGIGFAIPSNLAREIADRLISDGKFTRSWLGIGIGTLREETDFRDLVKDVKDGVVVKSIQPDGPAAKSDLRPADVITAVDGKEVATSQDLKQVVSRKAAGKQVVLDVHRNGRSLKLKVTPEAWPDDLQPASNRGPRKTSAPDTASATELGLTVKALTRDTAKEFGVDEQDGVIVTEVEPDGIAAERGFRPGDIITELNHQPVASLKEFKDALKGAKVKEGIVFNFVREGASQFRVLKDRSE